MTASKPVRICAILPLKVDLEKTTLARSYAQMCQLADEVIILYDGHGRIPLNPEPTEALELSGGNGVWCDWSNRMTLLARAAKYDCDWVMQLDDDETVGPTMTRGRIMELIDQAESGGSGEVIVKVRTAWSDREWRTDGVFGSQDKTFLMKNALTMKQVRFRFDHKHTLHHFPVLDMPLFKAPLTDYIVHWGMRTRALREKNTRKYQTQDPEQKFSCVSYDYLLNEDRMTLDPL